MPPPRSLCQRPRGLTWKSFYQGHVLDPDHSNPTTISVGQVTLSTCCHMSPPASVTTEAPHSTECFSYLDAPWVPGGHAPAPGHLCHLPAWSTVLRGRRTTRLHGNEANSKWKFFEISISDTHIPCYLLSLAALSLALWSLRKKGSRCIF